MKKNKSKWLIVTFIILTSLFNSCSEITDDESLDEDIEVESSEMSTLDHKINTGRGNETLYLEAGANPDCSPHGGNTGGFAERVIHNLNRSSYNLRFEFKFHKYFDFDRGGKVGYGLNIGDGISGCRGDESRDNKGGSLRIMWIGENDPNTGDNCTVDNVKTTKAHIIPYIYHRRMTGNCGDNFGKRFDIERDKWYTVVMKFKANTNNNADGLARIEIGLHGAPRTVLLNKTDMVWSFSSFKRNVTSASFNLFRGGGSAKWSSHERSSVEFRSVRLDN